MAKSVRASVSKRNRANLRKKVFGPVVDARTERLAAKLQEIASQPNPVAKKSEEEMDSDETGTWAVPYLPGSSARKQNPYIVSSFSRTTTPWRKNYSGQRG